MDTKELQSLRERANNESERMSIVAEGFIPKLGQALLDLDEGKAILALEVIFYLSLEVAENGIVNAVKKMMARGRLKQRKVALATYKNLQGTVSSAREDIASPLGEVNVNRNVFGRSDEASVAKKSVFGRAAFGESSAPTGGVMGGAAPVASQTPSTVTIFVEGMSTPSSRSKVETCLLKKEGVISFYSDIADEKVVIRTTCLFEEIQSHIWTETQMRGTTAKGDYSNFSQPGYLDEKNAGQQGGWLNGISSLLQIIAVKDGKDGKPAQQQKSGSWSSWW